MNKRDFLEVAIKMMGLYTLFSFIGSIIIAGAAMSSSDKFLENKTLYVLSCCLALVLYLVLALAFLWRGRRIAEMLTRNSEIDPSGERSALPPYARLCFWVRILGLYFFVAVVSDLVAAMAQAGVTIRSVFWWSTLVGETLQLALSVIFIFRSERVSEFVERHAEPSAGGNAASRRASA